MTLNQALLRIQNAKGISIVETLMALAVLSVVTFCFLAWAQLTYANLTHINESSSIESAMLKLKGAFGQGDQYCTSMLKGQSLDVPISEINYFDQSGNQLPGFVLKANESVDAKSSAKPVQMMLRLFADLGPANPSPSAPLKVVANLVIDFQKTKGPSQISRHIPISALLQGNKIMKCSILPSSSLVLNERLCEVRFDGHNYYNVDSAGTSSSKCPDQSNVKWVRGPTPFSATCPTGYRVAASDQHIGDMARWVCRAEVKEAGVNLPPRTYASGYVSEDDTWFGMSRKVDLATSTCIFAFVADTDTMNYDSFIKCVPL